MRLPLGTLVTNPVGLDVASTSDIAGIQACFCIQLYVPLLSHWMLTLCHNRSLDLGLSPLVKVETDWTTKVIACAVVDGRVPRVPMLTPPQHLLATADHVVMCSELVPVAELGSNGRGFGGQGVVLTNESVSTVGAVVAICPVSHCCLPLMGVPMWALIT